MSKKGKDKSKDETASAPTGKGRTLWIGLFFVACAWMFVLGVLVGRGTAPVQFDIDNLQKELAALKEAVIKKERLRFKIDSESAGRKTDMDFYEKLKTSKSDHQDNYKPLAVSSEQGRKPVNKQIDAGKKQKEAPAKVAKVKPSTDSRSATSPTSNDSEKKLTIQVASLRDPKIADRMVARLKDKWYPAYRIVAEIPGKGTWYRVRIGSFKNKAEAKSTQDRLKKDNINAILLPR